MDILKSILAAVVAICLTGCQRDVDIDIYGEPVLTVNSLITAGESFDVSVSHSWKFDDEAGGDNHTVSDAAVSIFANGMQVGRDYVARVGDRLSIAVESKEYGKAEAELTVPAAVKFREMDFRPHLTKVSKYEIEDNEYIEILFDLDISLQIEDPEEMANFFIYECEPISPPESGEGVLIMRPGELVTQVEPIFTEHIGQQELTTDMGDDVTLFFSDRSFAGGTYTLHLKYKNARIFISAENIGKGDLDFGYLLRLYSISESYYRWLCYEWSCNYSLVGDLANLGFGTTLGAYSNVTSGAGVVVSRTSSATTLSLKKFVQETLNKI